MIFDLKKDLKKNWKEFREKKMEVDFSRLKREQLEEVGQWPATVTPFFPLVTRCVARKEGDNYLLLFYDTLIKVNQLTVSVLSLANGYRSAKKIKEMILNDCGDDLDIKEEHIENILSDAGKYGIITWIPFSQAHIDRMK